MDRLLPTILVLVLGIAASERAAAGAELPAGASGPPPAGQPAGAAGPVPVASANVQPRPGFSARRVSTPPKLDGRLDDPAWREAQVVSDFVQQAPNEGSPPSERTAMRVVYDDEAVYVGFDCSQVQTPIVGRLTRRDQDSESDWVYVDIDSRRDGRTAAFLAVNVAEVVVDGMFHDTPTGPVVSLEWDENWEARTARTAGGWSAEMRIPLRILRFSPDLPVQSWGLAAIRYIGQRQETDTWPAIPRTAASAFPYFGRLDDLRQLAAREPLELRPFGLARGRRRGADPSLAASGFDAGVSAGLDLKLHLTPSLTLDVAVNPDFAQVEADQIVFNLGSYEILLPEKRPLFLEGADQLSTPLALFYSRRIGSSPATPALQRGSMVQEQLVNVPEAATLYGAAKVIGRVGDAWTVGALSVLAGRNDYQVKISDGTRVVRTAEPLTSFNVLRLRRDLGATGQVGLIGTMTLRSEQTGAPERICPTGAPPTPGGRCFRDAYTGGVDAVWRPAENDVVASAQVIGSVVQHGPDETQLDGTAIRSGDSGYGAWARIAKDGGRLVLADLTYTGLGRRLTFNDLGFMLRQNLHEVKAGLELRSLEPGPHTLERHLRLEVTSRRNLDALDLGTLVELRGSVRLPSFWSLTLSAEGETRYWDDLEIGSGAALERAGYLGAKLEVATDPRRKLHLSWKSELRFLSSGQNVDTQATITMQPLPQLEVSLTPELVYSEGEPRFARYSATPDLFARLEAKSAGATLHASYTFTPRLTLQAYGQLFLGTKHFTDFATASTMAGERVRIADLALGTTPAPADADFEQAALNLQMVLRWEYRLGSTLFLVYSRSQVPAVDLMMRPAMLRVADVASAAPSARPTPRRRDRAEQTRDRTDR
ncbi:MAG TPA: DUF5916 domain-containing protein, partial [Polyangia bacterium]